MTLSPSQVHHLAPVPQHLKDCIGLANSEPGATASRVLAGVGWVDSDSDKSSANGAYRANRKAIANTLHGSI